MLRCVICTAFGDPVDPLVSCISARSSSPTSIGSIGSEANRSATVRTLMPFSSSTGIATRNGSDTMTALASIMPMTFMVSSAQITRSVRGVGWWSIVRLAPRIHRPCAVGAISTGKPASTPTESPSPMPASARPPATRRARSCTSPQVWRTGSCGSPVTMPVLALRALRYIFSVNRLTTTSSFPEQQMSGCHTPPDQRRFPADAHTNGERLSLEMVIPACDWRRRNAHRGCRWAKSRPFLDR